MITTIIGAGTIGATLAHELTSRGADVRVVSRSEAHHPLPDGVEQVRADVLDADALANALRGSAVVLNTAQPAYPRWAQEFPQLERAVIDAAAATGSRLVLADNLYLYGRGDNGHITDTTAERPCSGKGAVRKAMAAEALDAHRAGRVQIALTRPSNYVGANYGLTQSLMLSRAKAGKAMQVLGSLDQPHSFSYVPDVARAMADVALADDAFGRAWILPTLAPVTQRDLCDGLWAALGKSGPAKVQALRGAGMRALGIFNPLLRATIEMMYEWDEPFTVDSTDFTKRFGWTATPVDQAIRETAA